MSFALKPAPATRFSGLSRPAALLVAALLAITICAMLAFAVGMDAPVAAASRDNGDLATYERIIAHMRAGQDYYDAARTELAKGHYGMQSVFNWRTPLLAWFLALFPNGIWPQVILGLLALAAGGAACLLIYGELGAIAAGAMVVVEILSLGSAIVPESILFSEIPAGLLILLSAAAYGGRRPRIGQGAAILALFLRELSAPYVLICLFLAWREKRHGEVRVWIGALLAYAAYFLYHYLMVRAHQQPGDLADPHGWVQFGGAGFVLATLSFNGIFFVAPNWLTAIFAPLAVLGLLAWPGPAGNRMALTVLAYLAAFAVIGQKFDIYWGAMYTPLMSLGIAWVPAALRDLWRALQARRASASG